MRDYFRNDTKSNEIRNRIFSYSPGSFKFIVERLAIPETCLKRERGTIILYSSKSSEHTPNLLVSNFHLRRTGLCFGTDRYRVIVLKFLKNPTSINRFLIFK